MDIWKQLRDDRSERAVSFSHGAIAGLRFTGTITEDEAELWTRRMSVCPGHDDEGGRSWCAYCGNLPLGEGFTYDSGGISAP